MVSSIYSEYSINERIQQTKGFTGKGRLQGTNIDAEVKKLNCDEVKKLLLNLIKYDKPKLQLVTRPVL